jgi:heterodisulfide reductase subunit C
MTDGTDGTSPRLESGLALRVERLAEAALRECFQCGKCSAGCPVGAAADLLPHEAVQAVLLGQAERLFASRFLWLCLGCNTCLTRCPNRVDLPSAVDALRALSLAAGVAPAEPAALSFHRAFLAVVRRRGRSHELSLIARYKRATGTYLDDLGLGFRLFRRGKIRMFPSRTSARGEVRAMFDREEKDG